MSACFYNYKRKNLKLDLILVVVLVLETKDLYCLIVHALKGYPAQHDKTKI